MPQEPTSFTFPFDNLPIAGMAGLTATGRCEIMCFPEDPSAWEVARIRLGSGDDEVDLAGHADRRLWQEVYDAILYTHSKTIKVDVARVLRYVAATKAEVIELVR